MMTFKNSEYILYSLLFETTDNYEDNLQTLLTLLTQTKENSIIVAPEVCLTSFDYERMDTMLAFAPKATAAIKKASHQKIVILTMLEEKEGKIFNFVKVFYNGEVVFQRAKARLFRLGNEEKYMQEGSDKEFAIVEVAGIKLALFVCFELRFKELWQKAEGADVIAVPSWWGKLRKNHFKVLTEALAIMNQCYVVVSDSANDKCTGLSGIITPKGEVLRNGNKPCLGLQYNKKEIELMRRYIDVGIK